MIYVMYPKGYNNGSKLCNQEINQLILLHGGKVWLWHGLQVLFPRAHTWLRYTGRVDVFTFSSCHLLFMGFLYLRGLRFRKNLVHTREEEALRANSWRDISKGFSNCTYHKFFSHIHLKSKRLKYPQNSLFPYTVLLLPKTHTDSGGHTQTA